MGDFRAELAALVAAYNEHGGGWTQEDVDALWHAVEHARDVLAQPEPGPAADGEVAKLVAALRSIAVEADRACQLSDADVITCAANLLEVRRVESFHVPRALSDEALRLLTSLPMEEIERRLRMEQPSDGWLPIDTAPQDGTEILASDYDAIEIVSWSVRQGWQGWSDREGRFMFASWWQPLPDHPPLPEAQ